MKRKSNKWKMRLNVAAAVVIMLVVLASCGSEKMNVGNVSSEQELYGGQTATLAGSEQESLPAETETGETAIEKIQKMDDPAARYDAAKEMYENGIKDDPMGHQQETMELLKIMAKSKYGDGYKPDAALLEKLDKLLEGYQGRYFVIPMDEAGVADGKYHDIPITMYDEKGIEIVDYYIDKDIVMKYHCDTASGISNGKLLKEDNANVNLNTGLGMNINDIISDLTGCGRGNNIDCEITYDDLGQPIKIKWKACAMKEDKQGNFVGILKDKFKTAEYELNYREDGYLLSAVRTGYNFDPDKTGEFFEVNERVDFGAAENIKLEFLTLEDGTCFVKGVAKANKKAAKGEEILQTHADGKVYYDLKEGRVTKIYLVDQQGDGLKIWRKFKYYYKSKGDVKDIREASPAYLIYWGKNASLLLVRTSRRRNSCLSIIIKNLIIRS